MQSGKPQRPYKSTFDQDESKRRREEATVQLRRQVRIEHSNKRRIGNDRQITVEPILSATSLIPPIGETSEEEIKRQLDLAEKLKNLPQYLADIQSDDLQRQYNGTQLIRKILSIGSCMFDSLVSHDFLTVPLFCCLEYSFRTISSDRSRPASESRSEIGPIFGL